MKGTTWPRPFTKDPKTGERRPIKGKSTWTYQFAVPKADGGKRNISKGGYRTKAEAEHALAEALTEHGQGGPAKVEPSKMALSTYLRTEWLPTLHGLRATTRRSYSDLVEAYVIPHLGDVRLCDLTTGQVATLYEKLRTTGRRRPTEKGPKGLSESSVHHVHVALSASLGHAVERGLLRVSPVTQLPKKSRPKVSQAQAPEMRVWTVLEAQQFIAQSSSDRLGAMFELALHTGLRRGELVALRWEDVQGESLSVRRSTTTVGYEPADGPPKSGRARTIDLDPGTVKMLDAHRKRQIAERLKWGEAWTDTGRVFTRDNGTPLHPQTALWHLRRLSKLAKVPEVRLHDLRHTHATLGLAAGVPVKVMQERLGHATSQITMDQYQHVVPGMQADAAVRIGALLRGVS